MTPGWLQRYAVDLLLCAGVLVWIGLELTGPIETSTWSALIAAIVGAALVLGTLIWALRGPGHPTEVNPRITHSPEFSGVVGQQPSLGSMNIGDFLAQVTWRSPEGSVVLWGSAANLALAVLVALFSEKVPGATWLATSACLWPLLLFFWHAVGFLDGRIASGWYRTVTLVGLALFPAAKVLNDLLRIQSL